MASDPKTGTPPAAPPKPKPGTPPKPPAAPPTPAPAPASAGAQPPADAPQDAVQPVAANELFMGDDPSVPGRGVPGIETGTESLPTGPGDGLRYGDPADPEFEAKRLIRQDLGQAASHG